MSNLESFNKTFYGNLASGLSRAIMDGDYEKVSNILKADILPHQKILDNIFGQQQAQPQQLQQIQQPQMQQEQPQQEAFTGGQYNMMPEEQAQNPYAGLRG